ncbi:MAG: tetratricopeptide repeat protein [Alphaproteobacteria bacterium]|jgi:protein O-GlcNAc transferase|nr:tetratricopeptide repeat protein [Alphaproteobacteria bacterium]MBT5161502.1 tetratricopeptide repeat protein [Alphaproteobacteria bacterium]MBT5918978.1 tetratricopeptide repeat protein [Alphaproteobacteria bacterium]MBT6386725.1 tetratricopeptide repeat protein [Alphaproteobacteria bacterium]
MNEPDDEIGAAKSEMAAGHPDVALKHWRVLLAADPDNITALAGSGDCLMAMKEYTAAADVFGRAHDLRPEILPLLYALGTAEAAAGLTKQARDHLQAYLERDDDNPHAHKNLATVLTALGDHEAAKVHAGRAAELSPDLMSDVKKSGTTHTVVRKSPGDWQGLFDKGVAAIREGEFAHAHNFFQTLLVAQPNNNRAWECLGVSELGLGHAKKALKSLEMALKIEPDAIGALHHKAIALRALGRLDESVAACEALLLADPGNVYAHSVRGAIFLEAGKIPAAIPDLETAIAPNADQNYDIGNSRPALQGALAYAYRAMCRWDDDYINVRQAVVDVLSQPAGKAALMVISPFQVLPLGLDGNAQAEVARRASHKAASSIGTLPKIKKNLRSDMRLRIGYLSPDFCNHSVATALHGVIVNHDRHRFCVEGFSLGRTHDDMTKKFDQDFDDLHDLSNLSHGQAAAYIAGRDIDILIELAGHTKGARSEILAYKPAPVQISAIGYGAPVCADFIAWHLVDKHLVPEAARKYYDEKLVDMPHCALPVSSPLSVQTGASRADLGLPETGLLLANFGGSYKIDPFTFDAWMKILLVAPDARLALLDNTSLVNDRLCAEARNRGVDPDRLVFVPFLDRSRHLARYAHINLCLDTLIHNGGVTSTDALWQGAPVLTMRRDDLPDRMGPSLLQAANLSELIAENIDDYVRLAAELANDSDALTSLGRKVMLMRKTAPLFDIALYTRNLEDVVMDLWSKSVNTPYSQN